MAQQVNQSTFEKYFTPVTGPIYVAIISGFLVLAGNIYQRQNELKLARIKNQQDIIKKAFNEKDLKQTKSNLEFFVKTGLIVEASDSIIKAIKDGSIDNIIYPSKITSPLDGDTINGSKTFQISGTAGFIDTTSNLTVLITDATVSLKSAFFYPTTGRVIFSRNLGKWIATE